MFVAAHKGPWHAATQQDIAHFGRTVLKPLPWAHYDCRMGPVLKKTLEYGSVLCCTWGLASSTVLSVALKATPQA